MADEDILNPDDVDTPAAEAKPAGDDVPSGVEILKRERDEYYDRLLRKTAEFDNYRRRTDRERRAHSDQVVEGLLLEILLIVDDFDRALAVESGEGVGAYRKGIDLIYAKLQDWLRKQGVRPFESVGSDFDPNRHQAVMHEASTDHREGEVMAEMQRGYMLGDRLLRPAMVKVAKA